MGIKILVAVARLIRPLNLFIIALSLYLARYFIVKPILGYDNISSSITDNVYMLIVLATVLMAAGGYVINDYFDTVTDAVNKPGKNPVNIEIPDKAVMLLYTLLTIGSVIIAVYMGAVTNAGYGGGIFFSCALLLYVYSAFLKTRLLAGNIVVAFLSAITILLSIIFDKASMQSQPIVTLVVAYAIFAFLVSLAREIIKDCEDIEGDTRARAATLPIKAGLTTAKWSASMVILIIFAAIIFVQVKQMQWENLYSFLYVVLAIQVPVLFLLIITLRAKAKKDFHRASLVAKFIMLTGLLSMPVFYITS